MVYTGASYVLIGAILKRVFFEKPGKCTINLTISWLAAQNFVCPVQHRSIKVTVLSSNLCSFLVVDGTSLVSMTPNTVSTTRCMQLFCFFEVLALMQTVNYYVSKTMYLQTAVTWFLARDSMLSALYAIANPSVCPSVCLSVCHTGGSVENGWTYHRNSYTIW